MKIFYKFALTSLFFLTFFTAKSQDIDLLKAFINKNNIAIRSVQKNAMQLADPTVEGKIKDLLKLQVISVNLYSANKDASAAAAYKVRQESLDFLSKNAQGSIDFFKITPEEKTNFSTKPALAAPNTYLSGTELKAIETIDSKNPALFNAFTTTIQ